MRRLCFDKARCTECHSCELMCSYTNFKVYNSKKAVLRLNSKFPDAPELKFCRQCTNPPCLKSCSFQAIYEDNGTILIDQDKCTGCGECIKACKFDSIFMSGNNTAVKCDTCGGEFKCVNTCKTGALTVRD